MKPTTRAKPDSNRARGTVEGDPVMGGCSKTQGKSYLIFGRQKDKHPQLRSTVSHGCHTTKKGYMGVGLSDLTPSARDLPLNSGDAFRVRSGAQ